IAYNNVELPLLYDACESNPRGQLVSSQSKAEVLFRGVASQKGSQPVQDCLLCIGLCYRCGFGSVWISKEVVWGRNLAERGLMRFDGLVDRVAEPQEGSQVVYSLKHLNDLCRQFSGNARLR